MRLEILARVARRAPLTDEEALIAVPGAPRSATARGDRVLLARVRAELEAGFDALATVNRAVTVFGSARTPRDHPDYRFARTIAARLGSEGHAIITGGGRGIM